MVHYYNYKKYLGPPPCLVTCLLLALVSGCGPSPVEKKFSHMVTATMQTGDADHIRTEVLNMMPTISTNINGDIEQLQVPVDISSLPLFAEGRTNIMVWSLSSSDGRLRGLSFVIGSGFGHWGLAVSPYEDGEKVARTMHGEIVPWKDGVYFFLER
jgi:hypothetical protein